MASIGLATFGHVTFAIVEPREGTRYRLQRRPYTQSSGTVERRLIPVSCHWYRSSPIKANENEYDSCVERRESRWYSFLDLCLQANQIEPARTAKQNNEQIQPYVVGHCSLVAERMGGGRNVLNIGLLCTSYLLTRLSTYRGLKRTDTVEDSVLGGPEAR